MQISPEKWDSYTIEQKESYIQIKMKEAKILNDKDEFNYWLAILNDLKEKNIVNSTSKIDSDSEIAIKTTLKALKNGESIALFPEGTRNGIEKGEKVKDGAAFFAVRTGAKVIPVGISGGEKPFKQMTIRYGKPMDFSDRDKNDKEELDKITEEIMEEIIKLSKEK